MKLDLIFQEFREQGIGLHDEGLVLSVHNEGWAALAAGEINRIRKALELGELRLEHIGSTSVPGLMAKPILDLVGEVSLPSELDSINSYLERLGYTSMGEYGIKGRRYFVLKNRESETFVHIHVFGKDDVRVSEHIRFRDYLMANADARMRYQRFKQKLVADSGMRRENYSGEKEAIMLVLKDEALRW